MWGDLAVNLQYLYQTQHDYESYLDSYLHEHQQGMAAYVQWGKIIHSGPGASLCDEVETFQTYSDYDLIVGNGVARGKIKEINIVKSVRHFRVKMHVTQVGPEGKFYVVWLQFRDFKDAKNVIIDARKGQVTFRVRR